MENLKKGITWQSGKGELATATAIKKLKKAGFNVVRVKPKTDTFFHTVKKRMVSVPNFSLGCAAEHRRRFGTLPYYYSSNVITERDKNRVIVYVSTKKTKGKHQIGIARKDARRRKQKSPLL